LNVENKHKSHTALIGIGSNIDPENNIRRAVATIARKVSISDCSRVWQNPAIGSDGPDYLNAALVIQASFDLHQLKEKLLLPLEAQLDRVRKEDKNADRTIDLDILIFDGEPLDDELWTQAHVSVPAAELMPDVLNPQTGEILREAAARLFPEDKFRLRNDLDLCKFL